MGQKIMFVPIWKTVLEHALMRKQIMSPPFNILRSADQSFLRKQVVRDLTIQILYMLHVSGLWVRSQNTMLVLLKLPMMEKFSRSSVSSFQTVQKGLVRNSMAIDGWYKEKVGGGESREKRETMPKHENSF